MRVVLFCGGQRMRLREDTGDTFKDQQLFDEMTARVEAPPWEVWRHPAAETVKSGARRHCPVP
jgi:hypothetical protein